jgi:hypothetical protein
VVICSIAVVLREGWSTLSRLLLALAGRALRRLVLVSRWANFPVVAAVVVGRLQAESSLGSITTFQDDTSRRRDNARFCNVSWVDSSGVDKRVKAKESKKQYHRGREGFISSAFRDRSEDVDLHLMAMLMGVIMTSDDEEMSSQAKLAALETLWRVQSLVDRLYDRSVGSIR